VDQPKIWTGLWDLLGDRFHRTIVAQKTMENHHFLWETHHFSWENHHFSWINWENHHLNNG